MAFSPRTSGGCDLGEADWSHRMLRQHVRHRYLPTRFVARGAVSDRDFLAEGDLLIGRSGRRGRGLLCALVAPEQLPATIGPGMIRVRFHPHITAAQARFVASFLRTRRAELMLDALCGQSIAGMPMTGIGEMEVPFPTDDALVVYEQAKRDEATLRAWADELRVAAASFSVSLDGEGQIDDGLMKLVEAGKRGRRRVAAAS